MSGLVMEGMRFESTAMGERLTRGLGVVKDGVRAGSVEFSCQFMYLPG